MSNKAPTVIVVRSRLPELIIIGVLLFFGVPLLAGMFLANCVPHPVERTRIIPSPTTIQPAPKEAEPKNNR